MSICSVQIFLPKIGLIGVREAFAELEPFSGEESERGDADHHPFVGFGGMARDGERVIAIA